MTTKSRPFIVTATGEASAAFTTSPCAQQYAQWISTIISSSVEVYDNRKNGGIIGQYKHGYPTAEFRGRGDEWYPAGPRE